ncbi:hypothetical protein E1211_20365 [Micromonospora sp. 15K316]|uniref:hypothetical protein n=1 Tax=Micromonospora sp. 15K316 TaxID=2530376 RepID=UPI00104C8AA6|nr:hypothetical protein [Micromonospora sp. 15K316]TDC32736.1 hypothetical protein E1211_20365 [Micromonospora sp. 15K316]
MTAINKSRPPDSTTEQARQQASRVGHQTAQAGGQVGHAMAEQGREVSAQARQQVRNLTGEAGSQLRDQAESQKHRAAEGLRGLGRDLDSMAQGSESQLAGEAVRRAADVAQRAAGWLDENEPADLLHDVRGYARRHPGAFLAGTAVAGLLFGRFVRNMSSSGNGRRSGDQMGRRAETGPYEQQVRAPYEPAGPYAGMSRAQNISPDGRRQDPGISGGVAP